MEESKMKSNMNNIDSTQESLSYNKTLVTTSKTVQKKEDQFLEICSIQRGLTLVKCNFKCFNEQKISLPQNTSCHYIFVFNLRDKIVLHTDADENISLSRMQNVIIKIPEGSKMSFYAKRNDLYKAVFVMMEKSCFHNLIEDYSYSEVEGICNSRNVLFRSFPNLKISDSVQELLKCKDCFPHNIIARGYLNIATGLLLEQYIATKKDKREINSALREWELYEIQNISEQIKENPGHPYTVKELAQQSGVSIAKLQQGFKEMHNLTVASYVREVRLMKAEELMKESDLNISEIVYSIGLCSRSYFTRIFKSKYNCTPTDYQRQLSMFKAAE